MGCDHKQCQMPGGEGGGGMHIRNHGAKSNQLGDGFRRSICRETEPVRINPGQNRNQNWFGLSRRCFSCSGNKTSLAFELPNLSNQVAGRFWATDVSHVVEKLDLACRNLLFV
jgi:hypothetical protein